MLKPAQEKRTTLNVAVSLELALYLILRFSLIFRLFLK